MREKICVHVCLGAWTSHSFFIIIFPLLFFLFRMCVHICVHIHIHSREKRKIKREGRSRMGGVKRARREKERESLTKKLADVLWNMAGPKTSLPATRVEAR